MHSYFSFYCKIIIIIIIMIILIIIITTKTIIIIISIIIIIIITTTTTTKTIIIINNQKKLNQDPKQRPIDVVRGVRPGRQRLRHNVGVGGRRHKIRVAGTAALRVAVVVRRSLMQYLRRHPNYYLPPHCR